MPSGFKFLSTQDNACWSSDGKRMATGGTQVLNESIAVFFVPIRCCALCTALPGGPLIAPSSSTSETVHNRARAGQKRSYRMQRFLDCEISCAAARGCPLRAPHSLQPSLSHARALLRTFSHPFCFNAPGATTRDGRSIATAE